MILRYEKMAWVPEKEEKSRVCVPVWFQNDVDLFHFISFYFSGGI